jgi:hypothetical protein
MRERIFLPGETRRSFLGKGIAGAAVLAFGGAGAGLMLRRTRLRTPLEPLKVLSVAEYSVLAAVADRVIPAGNGFPTPSEVHCAERADDLLAPAHPGALKELKQLISLFENALAGFIFDRRFAPFTQLGSEEQDQVLRQWRDSRVLVRRTGFKALKNLLCAAYYSSPAIYAAVGYPGPPELLSAEPAR